MLDLVLTQRSRAAWLTLALLGLSACGELPDPNRIEWTRILALRTQVRSTWLPDTDTDPRQRADALPFETISLHPFAVSPDGEVDLAAAPTLWLVCEMIPNEGLTGCVQRMVTSGQRDVAALPECVSPSLDLLDDISKLPGETPPCKIIGKPGEITTFAIPPSLQQFAGADFELTLVAGTSPTTDLSKCANDYLHRQSKLNRECMITVQRLEVGPDQVLAELAQRMSSGELPLPRSRSRLLQEGPSESEFPSDRHPRIVQTKVTIKRDGENIEPILVMPGRIIDAREGDLLKVEISSPAEDLQTYMIDGNAPVEERIRHETYDGRWFRTWGDLLAGESDDPESYNNWELVPLKDDRELGDDRLAYLYYVVRDGRQGVNWQTVVVRVAPALTLKN